MNGKPGGYWRSFLLWFFCRHYDVHDTFPNRAGICKRCHLPIDENGNAL